MLNLLRYSQLIAGAVLVAVVVALSLLYRGVVVDSLVESETHASVGLTKAFANAIWPSYASFVRRAGSLPPGELARSAELDQLERDLRALAQGLNVVTGKIDDLCGLTVFSADARQIGEDKAGIPGVRRARDGY